MANAALAYKCVEVAYMKSAFFKHPAAIKEHALQAASLMVPPGFLCPHMLYSCLCIIIIKKSSNWGP